MSGTLRRIIPRLGHRVGIATAVALASAWIASGGPGPATAGAILPAGPDGDDRAALGPTLDVRRYGAKGNGQADDTAAIQAAIDAAGRGGGTLVFPPGTYLVTSVGLRPGVRYSGYGATIRRPPRQARSTRTFDAGKPGYYYSGDDDSPPLVIEGLAFDGNRAEQGDYDKYQLEQAHLIFLVADPARRGRLRATIRDCEFRDGVADAVSVYTNVDATVSDCRARDCFRGGLTVTGGHSRVRVRDLTAEGKVHPTGIDVEVDGAGYGKSLRVDLTIDGLMLPDGDFDVGVSEGSIVLGTNIVAPRAPFYLYGGGNSTMRFANSVFGVGEFSDTANRIVLPGDVSFDHCQFRVEGQSDEKARRWAASHIYWGIEGSPGRGQTVAFLDCDFRVGAGIAEADTTYAVYAEADGPSNRNTLTLRGGTVAPGFDYGVYLYQGGKATVRDATLGAATALRLGAASGYPLDVRLAGLDVAGCRTYMHLVTHTSDSRIRHEDVLIDEAQNRIGTDYGIAGNVYLGRRIILGSEPPTETTHGLVNDVYRLREPVPGAVYEWACTASGTGKGAAWKPLSRVER
jgi:hypothetical protein